MSQPVLLKVYGNLFPAEEADREALAQACAGRVPAGDGEAVLREGDLVRISFEGLYFPVEDVLEAIAARLRPAQQGKLDVLDLEAWRLTRHLFAEGRFTSRTAPLNNVLDFSGH
ncbi:MULTISPECIES: hypothetical protein [unclassified Desulfovibrio]|uniref:hypothetical protein n=1 Tax=unclassified Desulfovibrio TaxID=2593640 RepID=UPI0013ED62CD|nr:MULTISPECIES: hypothetical protein [unclassified Desulfovibrio]